MQCILATGGYDNQVRLWRVDNGACHKTFQHPDSQVNALEIHPDKQSIAVAGQGQVRFYDVMGSLPTPSTCYDGHTGNVTAVGFARDGTWMFSGGEDETVKIWDVRGSPDYQRDFNHQSPVTCVALHPNQGEIISGDQEGRIVRWDLRANQCTEHLIPQPETAVRSISISSDGKLVAAVNTEGNCFIWDMHSGEMHARKKLVVHKGSYVLTCKFSPDGSKFATTSSDGTAKIFDVDKDFTCTAELKGHQMWVWDCAFSGDSQFLVSVSSDKTGKIWDLHPGESHDTPVLDLKGHQRAITSVALVD